MIHNKAPFRGDLQSGLHNHTVFKRSAVCIALLSGLPGLAFANVDALSFDESDVEKVVVTGQKIDRTLQETPNSVDVITGKDLRNYNINTLDNALTQSANIASTFGGTGYVIRGIDNTNVTGTGVADLATTFIDGAPASRDITFSGPLNLWDIQQVEVLRGPQSTLQGRNTLAGAIVIKTNDPTFYWSGQARVQYTDDIDERRIGIAVGGPLIEDQLAFRIAAETTESDGLIFNPIRDEYISENESTQVRAKLLWTPEQLPDLRVLLTHTFDDRSFGDDFSQFNTPDPYGDRLSFTNDPIEDDAEFNITVLDVQYDINDYWSVTSLSTLDKSERDRFRDGDLGPEPMLTNGLLNKPETFTSELRGTYQGDSLSGVIGAFYSDVDATDQENFNRILLLPESLGLNGLLMAPPPTGFGLDQNTADIVLQQYEAGIPLDRFGASPIDIETFAIYGDLTWEVSDKWRIFAGFRWDNEKQTQGTSQRVEIADLNVLPEPTNFGPLAPIFATVNGFLLAEVADANDAGQTANTDFSAFLPKLGLSYTFDDDMNISFVTQRGYRSGGTGVNQARAEPFTFDQEFIWNYELSFRSEWLDDRLTLNSNLFYIDWEDQQVTVFLSESVFDTETQNLGQSSVYGLELEMNYAVNDNLSVYANYGYSKTEIESDFTAIVFVEDANTGLTVYNAPENLRGNEFGTAPRHTFAAGFTYQHDNGFFASIDYNFVDSTFERINQFQNDTRINELKASGVIDPSVSVDDESVPSQSVFNMKVGYQTDTYGVYLIGRNIFEDEFFFNDFYGVDNQRRGRWNNPRLFGVSVEAYF